MNNNEYVNNFKSENKEFRCLLNNRTVHLSKNGLMKHYMNLVNAPDFKGKQDLLFLFREDLKTILLELELEQYQKLQLD